MPRVQTREPRPCEFLGKSPRGGCQHDRIATDLGALPGGGFEEGRPHTRDAHVPLSTQRVLTVPRRAMEDRHK